jgi:hypothetical protein
MLDYDSKAKQAILKQGLPRELQLSLICQATEPEEFHNFMELII